MKCGRFHLVVLVTVLLAALLSQTEAASAPGTRTGGAISFTKHTISDFFESACAVYATDVDGDGDVDIVGAANWADIVSWWENDGNQSFTEHTIDDHFEGARSVYALDLDGDGDVDILGAANVADEITWWENDGSESFIEHTIDGAYDGASSVHSVDVDGDGDEDVLGTAWDGNEVTWWENDGSENFTKHTVDDALPYATDVYAADVDDDGDVDLLGTGGLGDAGVIVWWENDGSESFTKHTIDGSFFGATCVYATDLDSDGDLDILGTASSEETISWWENDGSQSFIKHSIGGDLSQPTSVYATDLDGDADVDVVATTFAEVDWWENDGSENFTRHAVDGNFPGSVAVFATDLDGDEDVDVLAAGFFANEIAWWEQRILEYGVYLPMASRRWPPFPDTPVLNPISNPDGDGNYTVSWEQAYLAETYVLQEDDSAAFSSPTTRYSGNDTSWNATDKAAGTYYYRVKARNDAGDSAWSNVRSVIVLPPPDHYEGSSPSVSFDVFGEQVCNFDITVPFSSGPCRIRSQPGVCFEIVNRSFRIELFYEELGITDWIEGTFNSQWTRASGEYKIAICGNEMVIPPSTGSWEADKQ